MSDGLGVGIDEEGGCLVDPGRVRTLIDEDQRDLTVSEVSEVEAGDHRSDVIVSADRFEVRACAVDAVAW